MWYEILPSAFIIMGAMAVPAISDRYIHWLFNGKQYVRDYMHPRSIEMNLRDIALTGDTYKPAGIEAIPDEK